MEVLQWVGLARSGNADALRNAMCSARTTVPEPVLRTLLKAAAQGGSVDTVRMLQREFDAPVEAPTDMDDPSSVTPLGYAFLGGHAALAQFLVEQHSCALLGDLRLTDAAQTRIANNPVLMGLWKRIKPATEHADMATDANTTQRVGAHWPQSPRNDGDEYIDVFDTSDFHALGMKYLQFAFKNATPNSRNHLLAYVRACIDFYDHPEMAEKRQKFGHIESPRERFIMDQLRRDVHELWQCRPLHGKQLSDQTRHFRKLCGTIELPQDADDAVVATSDDAFDPFLPHCAQCLATDREVHHCKACRRVRYCGKQCQREHWKTHRVSCRATRARKQLQREMRAPYAPDFDPRGHSESFVH